jgi:hypothetical protein
MIPEKKNPLSDDSSLAAESTRGADGIEALPRRLERYSKARDRARLMADWCKAQGHTKEHVKLADCGEFLHFRHYYTRDLVRLHAAHFCRKQLLCPLCAIRRGSKVLQAYLARYEFIQTQRPDLKPYFVTFTVKNGENLRERHRHLQKNIQAMNKRRTLKRGWEVEKAEAGVWSYEVTNRGKGWHPHAHAIWLCKEAPDQQKLRDEWEYLTGDSHQVKVVPVSDPVDGFLEVFKYSLKFGDLGLPENWHAYRVLSGERLLSSFGLFYGVDVPEALTDEPLDELPFFDLFYRFVSGAGYSLDVRRSSFAGP